MLSGENGILSRATETKSKNAEAQADDQAKLAYMVVRTEIIAERVTNASYNAASVQNTEKLGTKVKKDLDPKNTNNPWNINYGTAGTITMTYTDTSLNKNNHQIEYTIELSGAGVTTITLKKDGTPMSTGGDIPVTPTQDPEPEKLAIIYPEGKDGSTVTAGDTISIIFKEGAETHKEDFMVLSEKPDSDNKIIAMPYYNITLSTTDPRQSSKWDDTMKIKFSESNYWSANGTNIAMNGANNVQQYIDAYNKKIALATGGIEENGVVMGGKAEAQIGRNNYRNSLGWDISSYVGKTDSELNQLQNPSGVGVYWLGTSDSFNQNKVCYFGSGPYTSSDFCTNTNRCGVRPVIKISLS